MINLLAVGSALALAGTAAAADTLLAKTALQLDKGSVTAELWGDRLPSGYSEDLLVLLKDERGKLVTAYAPSIKGGYYPMLEAVQVKLVDKKAATDAGNESVSEAKQAAQQLLVSVGQGDWQAASEFRILDFAERNKVQELFSSADSMGLVSKAYSNEEKLYVTLKDGQQNVANLPEGVSSNRIYYGGLYSLTAHDLDGDGQQELLGAQQLVNGKQNVADVALCGSLMVKRSGSKAMSRS